MPAARFVKVTVKPGRTKHRYGKWHHLVNNDADTPLPIMVISKPATWRGTLVQLGLTTNTQGFVTLEFTGDSDIAAIAGYLAPAKDGGIVETPLSMQPHTQLFACVMNNPVDVTVDLQHGFTLEDTPASDDSFTGSVIIPPRR